MADDLQNERDAGQALGEHLLNQLANDPQGPVEPDALEQWVQDYPELREAVTDLMDPVERKLMMEDKQRLGATMQSEMERLVYQLDAPNREGRKAIRKLVYYLSGTAAAVLLIVGALIVVNHSKIKPVQSPMQAIAAAPDIQPGSNKATLTLSDGKTITLDSAQNGMLARQGAATVQKARNGQLVYTAVEKDRKRVQTPVVFNTLSTPLGGQYHLILPDGSKVWLNAGSSLHFPTSFTGPTREVTLNGEGYFEVTRNGGAPFIIETPRQKVEVLGTSLDVMTYENEPLEATTLLQGAVRISAGPGAPGRLLKPGEQSQLSPTGVLRVVNQVDTESVVAWKNEVFDFNYTDLPSIMRQIGRWYNVDIVFDGPVPSDSFNAYISRNLPVSKVLDLLSQTGEVQFTYNQKTIHVKKVN